MGVHQFPLWSIMNYWTFFVFSIFLELQPVKAQTEEVSVPIWVIGVVAGVVGLVVLIALFVVTFVCGWYASKKCSRTRRPSRVLRKDPKLIGTEEVDNPGFEMSPVPSPTMSDIASSTVTVKNNGLKEIPRANVCLKHQLGTCAYGSIWDAEVVLGPQFASRALVKVLDAQSNKQLQEEFMKEANQLMPLVHPNVTRLFGVVTFTFPYYLALELPANGDLKSFLCTCRKPSHSIALTSNDVLLPMIRDAACGLAYLHSVPIVHRDVAARNCTVTNKLSVKVSASSNSTDDGIPRLHSHLSTDPLYNIKRMLCRI